MALSPGATLGPYSVTATIGEGGMLWSHQSTVKITEENRLTRV